jgi:ABC-2 type transport system ATP-binding protein
MVRAYDPALLIVDEPTAGLDPEERIRFRTLLSDLAGQRTVLLSTHIVEDVAQTCSQLAVMTAGQVIFQSAVLDLVQRARGHVWTLQTDGPKPEGDFVVASMLNLGGSVQYRLVGSVHHNRARPVEPCLEDGYVWLMRRMEQFAVPV